MEYDSKKFIQISTLGGIRNFFDKEDIKAINTILAHYKDDKKEAYTLLEYLFENYMLEEYENYLF